MTRLLLALLLAAIMIGCAVTDDQISACRARCGGDDAVQLYYADWADSDCRCKDGTVITLPRK